MPGIRWDLLLGAVLLCSLFATEVFSCSCGYCYEDEGLGTSECCSRVCTGPLAKRKACDRHEECRKLHGNWSAWTEWGPCEIVCPVGTTPAPREQEFIHKNETTIQEGTQRRRRECDLTAYRRNMGGRLCVRADGRHGQEEVEEKSCPVKLIGRCVVDRQNASNMVPWCYHGFFTLLFVLVALILIQWKRTKIIGVIQNWRARFRRARENRQRRRERGAIPIPATEESAEDPPLQLPEVNVRLLDGPPVRNAAPMRLPTEESGLGSAGASSDNLAAVFRPLNNIDAEITTMSVSTTTV